MTSLICAVYFYKFKYLQGIVTSSETDVLKAEIEALKEELLAVKGGVDGLTDLSKLDLSRFATMILTQGILDSI